MERLLCFLALLAALVSTSAQSPTSAATRTRDPKATDNAGDSAPDPTSPPRAPYLAHVQARQNGPGFVSWGFINGAWMPQSCSFGLSFMTVANYACCAANGACVYFTTCMAGTVYDPVNAVDCAAVSDGHCYTMYIVAEGGAQVATVYDCHTALSSVTLYRNTADTQAVTGGTGTPGPGAGVATAATTVTGAVGAVFYPQRGYV